MQVAGIIGIGMVAIVVVSLVLLVVWHNDDSPPF